MDILYRSEPPAYRGCSAPPVQRTRFLAGLWCHLFGRGSAPVYRTNDGSGSAAPASRCWWQVFPSTPAYQPAPSPSPDDVPTTPDPGAGEGSACDCAAEEVTGEDVPSTVYIVTG